METFMFGFILLLASFLVFLLVGQSLSIENAVILGIYLLLMALLRYFQDLPGQVSSAHLGCLLGVVVGSLYKVAIDKKVEV